MGNELLYFIGYNYFHRVVLQTLCFMDGNCVCYLERDYLIAPFFTCVIIYIMIYRKTNHGVPWYFTIKQFKTGCHCPKFVQRHINFNIELNVTHSFFDASNPSLKIVI